VIIGAGIAGMTSAIYAARKRMNFLIISANVGGQFLESGEVLNYPGLIKTTGAEFESIMEKQLKFNSINPRIGSVKKIEKSKNGYNLITDQGEFEAKSVIVATGARAKKLGIPGEEKYKNKGVYYCTICDGPLYKDKAVAVIGGGNSALEAADFMLNIAKKIYVINIMPKPVAHEYLQERIANNPKVELINNASTTGILGNGKMVKGLKYRKIDSKMKEYEIDADAVFIQAGRVPNTDFAKGFLKIDKDNHIEIDCTTQTSKQGIFAAGDCASGHEYQYIIAAGQGCMALLKAARYVANTR